MIKKDFKILFAGGGTGGHLFSGIAVAEEIRRHYPEAKVLFVGTSLGLETEIVPKAGFPLKLIQASPLKGSGILLRMKSLLRLPQAYLQSKKILREFRPDVVIGIGGYASGPMTLAAHFQKIFTAIIEQNAYPGFTNRRLARYVDRVFISFAKAQEFFDPRKTVFTGNPVRLFPPETGQNTQDRFTVFVMGGSQGAHALNRSMIEALPYLKDSASRLHFIHQTGKNDLAQVKAAYASGGFSTEVFAFDDKLGWAYARADLALCRAGAGTITELAIHGLPAVLVPYPYAADDHQLYNAKAMADGGAAELILNKDLNGAAAAERILHYLNHPALLQEMAEKAALLAKPNAAQDVLNHCLLASADAR
jgi:UDP-N-acetylglucosamine--N-acetylmuramyl-(pentapeptide) pyrophosphoryl-undecaprenol N-acetylglucosamine transferase